MLSTTCHSSDGDLSQITITRQLLQLQSALNEKELELLELRELHVQLVARSQAARINWEAALASKDRAILQLEEALASRQRAIEQLVSATSTLDLEQELQDRNAKVGINAGFGVSGDSIEPNCKIIELVLHLLHALC